MHFTNPFRHLLLRSFALLAFSLFVADASHAATPKILISANGPADVSAEGITPTPQVTVSRSQDPAAPGLIVTDQPGSGDYPGIGIVPAGGKLDLSAYGHVEATVLNTGSTPLGVCVRLDNPGDWKDGPTNASVSYIKPGATGKVRVIFGYNFDHPGYALKPDDIIKILIFSGKVSATQTYRIISLEAGGDPGEKKPEPTVSPDAKRIVPKDGILFGQGVEVDPAKQISAEHGGVGTLTNEGGHPELKIVLPAGSHGAKVGFKTEVGRWDLRDDLEVKVKVRNAGTQPVTPLVQIESKDGPTAQVKAAATLAPGDTREIVVPFIPAVPAVVLMKPGTKFGGLQPGTGTNFGSDAVSAVAVSAEENTVEGVLVVESIVADVPPSPALPDWLGKRPPVPGDWKETFHDEFDGQSLDQSVWNIYAPNYWDARSHFAKDNVIMGDGVVKLRFEKKRGYANDDPKQKQTDYTTGYLDSYGKWTQRYGYFESRLKIPTAPGLWPAFWLMPDRGVAAGPEQWKRASTGNGGMEFDICEPLTRWGKYRYNIAMHYDGYEKDHKQTGSPHVYAQPDKDGFLTAGLLWTPGSAVYYVNGKEVLRWEDSRISDVAANIIYTAVSGGWDNNAIDDSKLPADTVIDYVRVWQRADLASPADGKK